MLVDRTDSADIRTRHHLLVSCPNDGGLVSLGPDGAAVLDFEDTTGLFSDGQSFVRAYQTHAGCLVDWFDADGVRRSLRLNESSDTHDIFVDAENRLHAVSTGTNEVLIYDSAGRLLERVRFPGEGDSHHLNSLTAIDGRLVICAFGRFGSFRGWAGGQCRRSGLVLDLREPDTRPPVFDGLHQPHTPRRHGDWTYICDSRNWRILRTCGTRSEILAAPDQLFVRGLAFAGDTLYAGLSASRHDHAVGSKGEVIEIDLETFSIVRRIPVPFAEVYDIVCLSPERHAAIVDHYRSSRTSAWDYAFRTTYVRSLDTLRSYQTARLYWCAAETPFSEERSSGKYYPPDERILLRFDVPASPGARISLRFDPSETTGRVDIHRIEVASAATRAVLWSLDGNSAPPRGFHAGPLMVRASPLRFYSLGNDPSFFIPPLPGDGPLRVTVEFFHDPSLDAFRKSFRTHPIRSTARLLAAAIRA